MQDTRFKAMVVTETEAKRFQRALVERTVADLPDGDVVVKVTHSSLNFKDALSATGNRGVTRQFPHTPGIDAAGVVADSRAAQFSPGQPVIVTSYDLGMNTDGGFGQYIRVPAGWVIPMPDGFDAHTAMAYGTAGLTAALSILKLVDGGVQPDSGEILVTGATGGVGSMAVAILAKLGFTVAAVTGKADAADFLTGIGAARVIARAEAVDDSPRPMLKGQWAGVVDTVGGDLLATALKASKPYAVVTCCGLVASPTLNTSVFPFILRGVSLVGIDSAECPMATRLRAWNHLAGDWKITVLATMVRDVALADLEPEINLILKGGQRGRVVVRLDR
ncbi:MAG: YhdH/YhfP family quinone oxidoreductase [Pseudomonadota bacterium]